MPRKSKITAVPLDKPEQEEGLARAWASEAGETDAKTDAEQMTEIIQEVKEVAEPAPVEEPVKEKEKKATPKAKAKAKAKAEEPQAEVKVEEPVAEVKEEVKSEAKSEAKVACPDCGKQMSAKTLKYSHVPNCTAKKQKNTENEPEEANPDQSHHIPAEIIENEVQRRLNCKRAERAARREEMVNRLMQNAF
jgi:hypothetical protein